MRSKIKMPVNPSVIAKFVTKIVPGVRNLLRGSKYSTRSRREFRIIAEDPRRMLKVMVTI
jgi:hypothetical protein